MKCPHCGQEHPDQYNFCPESGKSLKPTTKKCPRCDLVGIPMNAEHRPHCGARLQNNGRNTDEQQIFNKSAQTSQSFSENNENISPDELYIKGQKHLSRALDNTPYTGVHSTDIYNYFYRNHLIPAANGGCIPALKEAISNVLSGRFQNVPDKVVHRWLNTYIEKTRSSKKDLLFTFGPAVLTYLFK